MKKTLIIILLTYSVITLIGSCMTMQSAQSGQSTSQDSHFGCTMHPEVFSISPGKCPKCGMDMVYIRASQGSSGQGASMSGGHHH